MFVDLLYVLLHTSLDQNQIPVGFRFYSDSLPSDKSWLVENGADNFQIAWGLYKWDDKVNTVQLATVFTAREIPNNAWRYSS